jgi:hypothetical protein
MKKVLLLLVLMSSVSSVAKAFSPPSPGYVPKGLQFDFDLNYGKTLDNNVSIINMAMFIPMMHGDGSLTANLGLSTIFSLDTNIFDLYFLGGMTMYPFKKYFSITFDFGIGFSYIIYLNHFPYMVNVKGNIDIPIYGNHNLTIGAGVQHRNTVKIFDYLKLNNNYYGIYNSYFFEIGYRNFIK